MPDAEEQSEENFDQFQELTDKLLRVPKKEVDELRKRKLEEQSESQNRQQTEQQTC